MNNVQFEFKALSEEKEYKINKNISTSSKNKDILREYFNLKEKKLNIKMNINKKTKEYNNNKIKNQNSFRNDMNIIIYLTIIISLHTILLKNNELNLIESNYSYIALKIKGTGNKSVFTQYREYFKIEHFPDVIKINGEEQYTINYSYYFNQKENFVELFGIIV